MPIIKKPDYNIFASEAKTGEIVDFPNLLRGWGVTLDQTAGKPPMEWFNALQKRTDEWLTYLSQRGLPEWQNTLDYPKDAVVQFGGKFYVAKKNTKNAQPDRSQNDWAVMLGSAASRDVGTAKGQVMEVGTAGLGIGPIAKNDAYSTLAQFYRIDDKAANKPPINGTSVGVVSLPIDGAPSTGYLAVSIQGDAWVGRSGAGSTAVTWARILTNKYLPKPSEIGAADVRNNFAAKMGENRTLLGDSQPTSAGVWSIENNKWTPEAWGTLFYTNNRPDLKADKGNGQFHHYLFLSHSRKLWVATNVNGNWSGWQQQFDSRGGKVTGEIQSTSSDNYRIVAGDYGTFWRNDGNSLYLLLTKAKDPYGTWNNLRPFIVDVKTGQVTFAHAVGMNSNLTINGAFRADKNISIGEDLWVDRNATVAGTLKVGNSTHASDGNIMGSRWGNKWLWDAVIEQVSGRVEWGTFNREVGARATTDYVRGNFVQNVRLSGRINQADTGGQVRVPDGCVFTGMSGANYNPSIWASYSYVQVLINGTWRNIGTS